jgi:hypothetical protein
MTYDPDADPELAQRDDYERQRHRNRVQHWHALDPERDDFHDEEDE